MGELPVGWIETTFGDLIKSVTNGLSGKQNKNSDGIPVSRIETIAEQSINFDRVGFLHDYDENKIEKYKLKEGDILFSHINSPIHLGKTAIFDSNKDLYHGINLLRIVVDNAILPDIFNYYCKYIRALGEFSARAQHAVNQSSINQKKLKEFNVPLPPLNEQIRISNKLDSLLAKVEAAQIRLDKIPTLLKRFRQAVLAAATSGELTKEWRGKKGVKWNNKTDNIGNLGKVLGGLTKNPKRNAFPLTKQYLRVANVYENELRLDDVQDIGIQEKELERVLLQKNDILVVEGNGSIDQIGRVAMWNNEIAECVHQNHLIKIRSNIDKVVPKFLLYYLMSPRGKREIVARATSGAGLYTLSISKISSINVPLIVLTEQKQIVKQVESLFSLADKVEKQYQQARQRTDKLTQSLLAKAFKGELVPQDPNDEPAEKLLARIQAEREKLKPAKKRGKR